MQTEQFPLIQKSPYLSFLHKLAGNESIDLTTEEKYQLRAAIIEHTVENGYTVQRSKNQYIPTAIGRSLPAWEADLTTGVFDINNIIEYACRSGDLIKRRKTYH